MKILAIETSTVAGSIAILDDEAGLIAEVRTDIRIVHAERLMPSVEWILQSSRVSIEDIGAFAISIGPGSFTGLRIGLATAKGFAYATGRPLIPVPTLDAFARTIPFSSYMVCPMLDARKNEVYTALYKWEGPVMKKVMPETAISPEALLKQLDGPILFTGEGTRKYREMITDKLKTNALFAPASKMTPAASTVAEIALEEIKQGRKTDPVSLIPFYIRKSEAELKWKG